MADREIIAVERRERSTLLRLSCGHDRSVGGHVWAKGRVTVDVKAKAGDLYDCHDGHCGSMR